MTYVNEASVIATSVIFIVLGIVAVSLRGFVRQDRKVALGADDWLIVVALVWSLAGAFLQSGPPLTWDSGLSDTLDRKLHRHDRWYVWLIECCYRLIVNIGAAQHTIGSHSAAPNSAAFFHNGTAKSILLRKVSLHIILSCRNPGYAAEDALLPQSQATISQFIHIGECLQKRSNNAR